MNRRDFTRIMLRVVVPFVVAMTLLIAIIAWMAGAFASKIPPGEEPVAARLWQGQPVAVVKEITKQYVEEAIGSFKAASRTVISAKVLATIDEVAVAAGDEVTRDQLLVRLASQDLEARLRQAEQSLVAATAGRQEADAAFQRSERLQTSDPGAISRQEYERVVAQLQVAKANESRLQQAVTEAKVMLSYTTIQAPKSGKVVDRLAEPGDMARPGEPLLVLYDAASLRLEAPVVERLAVKLKTGDPLTVRIDAVDREVEGRVDEIVPQAEALSRSFLVKVAIPASEDLFEGMFGRLIIPAGRRQHLCVPLAAVQTVGQLQFVDVVQPDQTLARRLVKIGRVGMPGRAEVLSGVEVGQRVVLYADDGSASPNTGQPEDG